MSRGACTRLSFIERLGLFWVAVTVIFVLRNFLLRNDKTSAEGLFERHEDVIVGIKTENFDLINRAYYGHYQQNILRKSSASQCMFPNASQSLPLYIMALQNSIRIVPLPPELSSALVDKCKSLGPEKKAITSHPHSLELQFPKTLTAMSVSSLRNDVVPVSSTGGETGDKGIGSVLTGVPKDRFTFNPLWTEHGALNSSEPLFYYVAALPYHVIYCTNKKNNKEDWTGRDSYWKNVADYLLSFDVGNEKTGKNYIERSPGMLLNNMGLDIFLPASHPQSAPSRIHPFSISYLQRASFLKTDFDISGSDEKDVIVPYYIRDPGSTISGDENSDRFHSFCGSTFKEETAELLIPEFQRNVLLLFAGGDNPKQGYRSLFLKKLKSVRENTENSKENENLNYAGIGSFWKLFGGKKSVTLNNDVHHEDNEIFFSLDSSSLTSIQYDDKLSTSRFCLILPGDTSSSKRFFSAVSFGCIPVIISDHLRLPFSNIIDYDTFTIRFSESVVYDISELINHIKSISPKQYSLMRCAASEAKKYLIYNYKYQSENTEKSIVRSFVNPVTLTFIDALMRREKECSRTPKIRSVLCTKILKRLAYARGILNG